MPYDPTTTLRLLDHLASAVRHLAHHGNDVARARVAELLDADGVELAITVHPGRWNYADEWVEGGLSAGFADPHRPFCWDDCDGIFYTHRSGWCRWNPEHADLDCACWETANNEAAA